MLEFDTRPFSIFVASRRTWWAATLDWFRTTSPAIYNVTQFWWERRSWSLTAVAGGSCLPDMGSCWPLWKLTKGGSSVWSSAGEHGTEEGRRVLGGQLKRRAVHLPIRSPEWNSAGTLRCPWSPASLLGLEQLQWAIIIERDNAGYTLLFRGYYMTRKCLRESHVWTYIPTHTHRIISVTPVLVCLYFSI